MAGIVSYGAYIPIYRLSREVIGQVWGGGGAGERAVANSDEDSITMAVEAALDCLHGIDRNSVDGLYFASTTQPYKLKQSASIVAAAADLREDIITADFTDSLRSATIAMRAALDAVMAGSARKVLVVASECRVPAPNSEFEPIFGDGAAAILIGDENPAVNIEGSCNIASEFIDTWRLDTDRIIRTWEDRFIREEGYNKYLRQATSTAMKKLNLTHNDFAKAAFYAPDLRSHTAMARALGFDAKTQVQDPLFNTVGNTGVAFAPMMLAAALEEAKPEDRILLANYSDGADAYVLKVTEAIGRIKDRRSIESQLNSKMMLSYGKYLKFRNLTEFQPSLEYELRSALPMTWRDHQWVYRLHGYKCKSCGRTQYPKQRACIYCQARGNFEEVSLLGKRGTLFTFSMDERAPVLDPPNVLAVVDLEEIERGCRFYSQMTDRDPTKIEVGMPMELTFRKMHDSQGIHNYFWKCRPARGQ